MAGMLGPRASAYGRPETGVPMNRKSIEELHAIHESAHAVMAARMGWTVSGVHLGRREAYGYVDAESRRWSRRADILIGLAGHAADLRLARLHPRYREHDDPYAGVEDDLTIVFELLAEAGRADSLFPRFLRALDRAESILAEPGTWAAVRKVAAVLLRRGKVTAEEFASLVANVRRPRRRPRGRRTKAPRRR
jgi:hypothetical protein